ncbi:hypothetical protein NBRC116600_22390 [Thalassotalea sp. SU-HH00458]
MLIFLLNVKQMFEQLVDQDKNYDKGQIKLNSTKVSINLESNMLLEHIEKKKRINTK